VSSRQGADLQQCDGVRQPTHVASTSIVPMSYRLLNYHTSSRKAIALRTAALPVRSLSPTSIPYPTDVTG
jgi:hypothetical protein